MRSLATKARLLASSPLLTADQRFQLRNRLAKSDAPVGVVATVTTP